VTIGGEEEERTLRERFIKSKRPLNLAHIFLKKDKELKTRTTTKNNFNFLI
jgi:hypothetical protein